VVVVFVVGSKLSRLIARYGPHKLERWRREQLSTGEIRQTKASNEEKTWLQGTVLTRRDENERATGREGQV